MLGKLRPQATTRGRLSHSSLSTDKDPLQRLLFKDVFEGGIGEILVVVVVGVGHIVLGVWCLSLTAADRPFVCRMWQVTSEE